MKIGVSDRHVIGDRYAAADRNSFGAHQNAADKRGVIAYFGVAGRLDIERCPSEHTYAITKNESRVQFAAKAGKTIAALDPASLTNPYVGRERAVVPSARDFT